MFVGAAEARSDAELVAELQRLGGPMSGRKVMRALGVGWPRAKRLVDLAGWSASTARRRPNNGNRQTTEPGADEHEDDETTPAGHIDSRTNP